MVGDSSVSSPKLLMALFCIGAIKRLLLFEEKLGFPYFDSKLLKSIWGIEQLLNKGDGVFVLLHKLVASVIVVDVAASSLLGFCSIF